MLARSLIATAGLTLTPWLLPPPPHAAAQPEHDAGLPAGHLALDHTAIVAVHRLDPESTELAAAQLQAVLDVTATLAGVHHLFVVDERALEELTGVAAADVRASHGDGVVSVFLAADGEPLFSIRGDPAMTEHAAHFRAEFTRTTRALAVADYNLPNGSLLAIEGYDPVAYFTLGRAVKGVPAIEAVHEGVTYRFATAEDRKLFVAEPERYAPTYGGWCASAMGDGGRKVGIDPTNFKVKDGRLLLFYKSAFGDALKDWNKHEREWEPAADRHWQTISGESPRR